MVSVRNYFRPLVLLTVGLGLATSACSSSANTSETAPPPSPSASASSSPRPSAGPTTEPTKNSPQAGSSAEGETPTCATGDLDVSVAPAAGGGSAGTSHLTLTFTNTSARTCAMDGWPGVSFVGGGDGKQIGVPAKRSGNPSTISLGPDDRAISDLTESNPGANGCSTRTDGFRVYPPNNKAAVFVKQAGRACADDEPLLTVEPVHLA